MNILTNFLIFAIIACTFTYGDDNLTPRLVFVKKVGGTSDTYQFYVTLSSSYNNFTKSISFDIYSHSQLMSSYFNLPKPFSIAGNAYSNHTVYLIDNGIESGSVPVILSVFYTKPNGKKANFQSNYLLSLSDDGNSILGADSDISFVQNDGSNALRSCPTTDDLTGTLPTCSPDSFFPVVSGQPTYVSYRIKNFSTVNYITSITYTCVSPSDGSMAFDNYPSSFSLNPNSLITTSFSIGESFVGVFNVTCTFLYTKNTVSGYSLQMKRFVSSS